MFSANDLKQIQARGIRIEDIEQQLAFFREGFPFLNIVKAATAGNGLRRLPAESVDAYAKAYEAASGHLRIMKFVPASGAATRMFQDLFAYLNDLQAGKSPGALAEEKSGKAAAAVLEHIRDFAFYHSLAAAVGKNQLDEWVDNGNAASILRAILYHPGLGYGSLPKGLLEFHRYGEKGRTPFEEHLEEAAVYARSSDGYARLHITVSPEHRHGFMALVERVAEGFEREKGLRLQIDFSEQKSSTDTIAVDPDNQPFRNADGSLLFRPAGHGALIENLNGLDADLIFIKNIDNVAPDRLKAETIRYKKALAGVLIEAQERIFHYIRLLGSPLSPAPLAEVEAFVMNDLCTLMPPAYAELSSIERQAFLRDKLNRPLRVCGMVKNQGEPGGGPFWAQNTDGSISLQIAESAQIDMDNPVQREIARSATHFNPVDLVCATRDQQGNPYDLLRHRDPKTGFISSKSKDGKSLKALELPGLWNGAMSDWNTIFVEVPLETFSPVKTVLDLLRPAHQG